MEITFENDYDGSTSSEGHEYGHVEIKDTEGNTVRVVPSTCDDYAIAQVFLNDTFIGIIGGY